MEINTHNTAFSGERVFRMSGVLQREDTDKARSDQGLQEIIRTITDSEKIVEFRVPADRSNSSLLLLDARESPDGI